MVRTTGRLGLVKNGKGSVRETGNATESERGNESGTAIEDGKTIQGEVMNTSVGTAPRRRGILTGAVLGRTRGHAVVLMRGSVNWRVNVRKTGGMAATGHGRSSPNANGSQDPHVLLRGE